MTTGVTCFACDEVISHVGWTERDSNKELSEKGRDDIWSATENAENGGTVFLVANVTADSESEIPISY